MKQAYSPYFTSHHHRHTTTTTTTITTTTTTDLTTTLSTLTSLINLSHQTLTSLSTLFSTTTTTTNNYYIPCPYNPNHLMAPESLFHHTLHCPSSPSPSPSPSSSSSISFLLPTLHYPNTLNPRNPDKDPIFTRPIGDPTVSDLTISSDGHFDEFYSNFFYKDCPAVVTVDGALGGSKCSRTVTLPGVLYVECGDFAGSGEVLEDRGFDKMGFRVLPSDLWAIQNEVEGWTVRPSCNSLGVLCALSRINSVRESDLKRWVIAGSLRYGVVIDVYMRDHVCVLFRLCLRAIRKEALQLLPSSRKEKTASGFECPVFVKVVGWVVSQLYVLYGEGNANCFAVYIFKQCVLESAKRAAFLPLDCNLKDCPSDLDANGNLKTDGSACETHEENSGSKAVEGIESLSGGIIFVSHVAAAIAALHERSLLESKLKALHLQEALLPSQWRAEHTYLSQRAEEERKTRSDYRAIIDHDGFRRKQATQVTGKRPKTKEELLADERDYKRRRMSYRGKKLKRNHLEVMRDIINEYMEEIKLAGGIGCFDKGDSEAMFPIVTCNGDEQRKQNINPSEAVKYSTIGHGMRPSSNEDAFPQDYEQRKKGHGGQREHLENQSRSSSRDRHGRNHYNSRSPERHRVHDRSHDQSSRKRQRDSPVVTESNYREKRSSRKSYHYGYTSSGFESDYANGERKKSAYRDMNTTNSFEDRYKPKTDSHEDD